jgi:hypothetical protein
MFSDMLQHNNKTVQDVSPIPFLTNNFIYRGDKIMANLKRIKEKKICQVDDCGKQIHAKGFCIKHYTQIRKHDKILNRTKYDPNEFRFDGDDCYISLYDKDGNFVVETIIDRGDYEKVKNYKWHISNNYVKGVLFSKIVLLSRFLIEPPDELDAEHKDQNTLNNRRSNLRFATRSQNMTNRGKQINNTSGYKGVYFEKRRNLWYSELRVRGEKLFLGYYTNRLSAAEAYKKKSMELLDCFVHSTVRRA